MMTLALNLTKWVSYSILTFSPLTLETIFIVLHTTVDMVVDSGRIDRLRDFIYTFVHLSCIHTLIKLDFRSLLLKVVKALV